MRHVVGLWVLSPKEDEINLYANKGGGFASGKGGKDASGRVGICEKKGAKSRWDFTPRGIEAGVFISARLAWILFL